LELGAIDGIRFTTTKFFEDHVGFSQGVLTEPVPISFKKLLKNRPNCECFNYVIHSDKKQVEFLINKKQYAVGCINNKDSKKVIRDFQKSDKHKDHSIKKILPAERLDVVLQKTKLQYLDLWVLDVEGSELQCLKSMDWSIPIGLVVVEYNHNGNSIHNIMLDNGFTLIDMKGRDCFYFNFRYFRKKFFSI